MIKMAHDLYEGVVFSLEQSRDTCSVIHTTVELEADFELTVVCYYTVCAQKLTSFNRISLLFVPLTFIMLVDSLRVSCTTHKFIDDTNLSEIVTNSAASRMQDCCNELIQQSEEARMVINGHKSKEMVIGLIAKDPMPHLMLSNMVVD